MLIRLATVLVALGLVTGGASVRPMGAAPALAAAPSGTGAPGIGDPYFPEDGNGGIDVLSYDIHDAYRFTGRLSGWTRLTLRTTERLRSFDLDFLLPVSSVRLSTGPATFDRPTHHELRITPQHAIPAGTKVRVAVRYDGRPARYAYAGESNWVADASEAEAVNEPHMAPWWFPANDHPLDKARMDLHITVPADRQVVANGRLLGVRRDAGHATYHWSGGGPMATYLAFFVAGRFVIRQGTSHHLPYYVAVSRQLDPGARRAALKGLLRTPAIVAWLQQAGRSLRVLADRWCRDLARPGLLAGEPDPAGLPPRRLPAADGPRARPPVVRRLGVGAPLDRRVAQRGVRDVHGAPLDRGSRRPDHVGMAARRVRRRRPPTRRSGTSSSPTRAPATSSTGRSTSAAR